MGIAPQEGRRRAIRGEDGPPDRGVGANRRPRLSGWTRRSSRIWRDLGLSTLGNQDCVVLKDGVSAGGTIPQTKWAEVTLEEIGVVGRGRSRHRPRHAPELYGGPYPFIQTGDIKASGGRITSHSQTYNEVGLAQSRLWPANTMAITIAANIAETALLTYPACFPDSVVGFIPDESKCDVRFVEYTFRHLRSGIQHEKRRNWKRTRQHKSANVRGVAFPHPPTS